MPGCQMHRNSWCDLRVTIVENYAACVQVADEPGHIFYFVHIAEETVAHVPAGGECHLFVLQMKRGVRDRSELPMWS